MSEYDAPVVLAEKVELSREQGVKFLELLKTKTTREIKRMRTRCDLELGPLLTLPNKELRRAMKYGWTIVDELPVTREQAEWLKLFRRQGFEARHIKNHDFGLTPEEIGRALEFGWNIVEKIIITKGQAEWLEGLQKRGFVNLLFECHRCELLDPEKSMSVRDAEKALKYGYTIKEVKREGGSNMKKKVALTYAEAKHLEEGRKMSRDEDLVIEKAKGVGFFYRPSVLDRLDGDELIRALYVGYDVIDADEREEESEERRWSEYSDVEEMSIRMMKAAARTVEVKSIEFEDMERRTFVIPMYGMAMHKILDGLDLVVRHDE